MGEYLKPSEVHVTLPFPFVGVFGKAEVEVAIAAVVLASTVRDAWEPVTMADLRAADAKQEGIIRALFSNPFIDFGYGVGLAIERGLLEHTHGEVDTFRVLPACLDIIAKRPEVPRVG